MQETVPQSPAKRQKYAYQLDAEAFNQLVKAFHGDKRDYEIGEIFGYDDSEWSLIKTGERYMPQHMLSICTHELFPHVLVAAYARKVAFKPRGSRR